MKAFAYHRATDIQVVLSELQAGARPLAGGTDLLTLMKADVDTPARLVDVKRLEALAGGICADGPGLEMGALTTLAELERNAEIVARYRALSQAAAEAATPQLRNMATLGGNLLQQPRCWYFRHRDVHCWRKGGSECPARDGENRLHALFGAGPCHAVHPSDPAVALCALAAQLRLRSAVGERELPVQDLFALPQTNKRSEVRIEPGELIQSVALPAPRGPSIFLKAMDRKVWAFALVSVAVQLEADGGYVEGARIVLGGVAPIPWRVPAAERALADGAAPARVAEIALEGAAPLRQNRYKIALARALVERALTSLQAEV
jgi:xanthine dehydrogenase YagS FAD-binding subunit